MPGENGRIARRFAALRDEGRAGLVTFLTAGDPDEERAMTILRGLPDAGADVIELGMPFTDPMADGPSAMGSVKGMPISMTSEPAAGKPLMISRLWA